MCPKNRHQASLQTHGCIGVSTSGGGRHCKPEKHTPQTTAQAHTPPCTADLTEIRSDYTEQSSLKTRTVHARSASPAMASTAEPQAARTHIPVTKPHRQHGQPHRHTAAEHEHVLRNVPQVPAQHHSRAGKGHSTPPQTGQPYHARGTPGGCSYRHIDTLSSLLRIVLEDVNTLSVRLATGSATGAQRSSSNMIGHFNQLSRWDECLWLRLTPTLFAADLHQATSTP